MKWKPPISNWKIRLYQQLLKVRPAQLGALLKQMLFIRRYVITVASGHKFLIDPVTALGLTLLRKGVYEPRMTFLLNCLVRNGDTVVDIGANEGYFSIVAADRVGNGTVLCVEPQSRLIPIIASNVQLNQLMSVHIEQVALSEREGKLEIFLRPSTNTGASSMYRYWNFGRTSENVLQTTLDQLLQRYQIDHVRFLKCDCEGAEYLVVRGGSEAFKQQRFDFIGMEYHPHICGAEHCTETHTFLSNVGYVLCDVQGFTLYHLPQFADEVGELINERQYPGLSKP